MTQSLSQSLKLDFCSFPCRLVSLTAALLHFYSPSPPATQPTNTAAAAADRLAYQSGHEGKTKS